MRRCHRLSACEECSIIGAASIRNGACYNVECFNLILICSSKVQVGCPTFTSHSLVLTDSLPNISSAISPGCNGAWTLVSVVFFFLFKATVVQLSPSLLLPHCFLQSYQILPVIALKFLEIFLLIYVRVKFTKSN